MPAWVLSVTLATGTVKQGVENAVYVSDSEANVKRLPVSLTLEPDTCTLKYEAYLVYTTVLDFIVLLPRVTRLLTLSSDLQKGSVITCT